MTDKPTTDKTGFSSGGGKSHLILTICSLLYIINYMDRQVLSVVLQPMKVDLGLTDAQCGMLQTIFFLSMALLAFPVSFLIDRWSRRKTVAIMAIIWSAATYITGLGKSFLGVLIPRIAVGTGEAGFSAGGTAWITAAYPTEKRGKALGFFNASIVLGGALGAILGGYLATKYGWRTPFFVFAIPGIVLGIIAFFLPDYKTIKTASATTVRSVLTDTAALWRIPSLKWLFIAAGMNNVVTLTMQSWLPAVIQRSFSTSAAVAGVFMGVFGVIGIIGAISGGFLTDAWHRRNNRARMLLPMIAEIMVAVFGLMSMLALYYGGAGGMKAANIYFVLWMVSMVLFFITAMLVMPAMGAVSQDVVHPRLKGISWGMTMFCLFALGGGWAPLLVGKLSDLLGGGANGLQIAIMASAVGGLLSAFCFWKGSRHFAADHEKAAGYTIEAER